MSLSSVTYTGNGAATNFAIPFPYLDATHLYATVNDQPVSMSVVDGAWAVLASAPASGASVKIKRTTPSGAVLVDFEDASTLTEHDLDTALTQMFYLVQESLDDSLTAADTVAAIRETALLINTQFAQLQSWFADGQFYQDYGCFVPYSPQAERVILGQVVTEALRLQGNFVRCKAATKADLDTGATFRIREYTPDFGSFTQLGTITFTPGSHVGAFLRDGGLGGSDFVFTPGRILEVSCVTPSETLRDISLTLSFRRAI